MWLVDLEAVFQEQSTGVNLVSGQACGVLRQNKLFGDLREGM